MQETPGKEQGSAAVVFQFRALEVSEEALKEISGSKSEARESRWRRRVKRRKWKWSFIAVGFAIVALLRSASLSTFMHKH